MTNVPVIFLIFLTFKSFDGFVLAESANVDALIGGAGREGVVGLPVDVKGGRRVEGELLRATAVGGVPNDGGFVHAR